MDHSIKIIKIPHSFLINLSPFRINLYYTLDGNPIIELTVEDKNIKISNDKHLEEKITDLYKLQFAKNLTVDDILKVLMEILRVYYGDSNGK